jgi:hypothetical protein
MSLKDKILGLGKVEVGEILKGTVVDIGEVTEVNTKFGKSYRIPLIVELIDNRRIEVSVFVREKTLIIGKANPRSNLFKILETYGCKTIKDLLGKLVNVRVDSKGFYRLVY